MHVIAKAHAEIAGVHVLIVILDHERIDYFGTRLTQLDQRLFEYPGNFRVAVVGVDERTQNTKPFTLQGILVQESRVVTLSHIPAEFGVRIRGIVAGDDIENLDAIGNGARHRAGNVTVKGKRDNTVATGEPHGRANAEQGEMGGRSPNRVAGVTAHADDTETRRNARRRPATGAGRHTVEIVRICSRAVRRTNGLFRAERPFRHVGFRDDDGIRFAQFSNHERIVGGHAVFQRDGAAAGRHIGGIVIVFQQHWRAEERSERLSGRNPAVYFLRLRHGVGIGEDDGVQPG